MEKRKVLSKYFAKEVELELENTTSTGQGMTLITHDSLTRVFDENQMEYGLRYTLSDPYFNGDRIVYHCRMADKHGRDLTEIGESCMGSLPTQIGKDYAATMAAKRAFDAVAIRFFQLDTQKAYSVESIPAQKTVTKSEETNEPEATVMPDEFVPVTEEAPFEENTVMESVPSTITSQELPEDPEKELALESEAPEEEPEKVVAPEDAAVPDPVLEFGKYKGKKVSEVITINSGWLTWAIENLQTNDPNKKAVVEAARIQLGMG